MQRFKRVLSSALVMTLLISILAMGAPLHVHAAASFSSVGGWNETIYAKISGISDSDVTGVSYTGTTSGSLTGQDLEYLVRSEDGGVRIDILGLKAGTYTLTVTTKDGNLTQSGIVVPAQDRSGYAHFGDTEGVGAYTNDGTLKANAIVLYVTNENKNTVSVTSKDGTTVTGIGNILGSTGMDVGGGLNSKGGKANTNQDILRKLAADGTPLVVRIIGNVKGASSTSLGSAKSEIEGLTAYDSVDYGGTEGDNGFMARMSGGKNITIEGVGSGATIDGWGLHFICQTADYAAGYGRSFELRNITFKNVPEDCVGMEGQQEGSSLTAPVERCWVHNCAFYGPTLDNPGTDSDKSGGDGACDFKRGNYFTNSYCYYEGYHKTNLVGSSDTSLQYHLTYHHNYWKNCESRGPLARQADIHMYNNIFEGQTSYCMNPRANAYIFSEYNMFLNCKNPVQVDSGAVKSYNDSFSSCTGDNNATIVTNKSEKVNTSNLYANFDTNSSISYIPSGNYDLQESLTEMKAVVLASAGAQPQTVISPEDVDISVIPADRKPTAAVVLPYNKSLNNSYVTSTTGTYDNIVFNVGKIASDSLTVGGKATGCDIVFYIDRTVNISMTGVSGTYLPVLCNAAGEAFITGTGEAKNLPAGYYFIQSSGYDVGSSKFKEAKVSALSIEPVIVHGENDHDYAVSKVVAPTCTEGGYTVYTCSCGATKNGDETAAKGHTPGAAATCTAPQTCTVCGDVVKAALGHNYSDGYCTGCGAVNPADCAHGDTVIQNAKDATCSAEGYTGDTFCNICKTVTKTGTATEKLAHTPGADATCTTAQTCTVCGATVTAALGHSYVDGKCTRCGAEDLSAAGYVHNFDTDGIKNGSFYTISGNEKTGLNITISELNLTFTKGMKLQSSAGSIKFTPDKNGTVVIYLTNATSIKVNGTENKNLVAAGNAKKVTLEVTAGSTYEITKGSGEAYILYVEYAPTGSVCTHSKTTTTTVDATCTAAGSITVTCDDCKTVISTTTIPVADHNYVDGKCSSCGAVNAATCAHNNKVTKNAKAATCSAEGYTGDTYCNDCKTTIATGTVIGKLDHTPGADATCTTAQTCTDCGTTITAALGHNYVNGKCDNCGKEQSALEITEESGWLESAYAVWKPMEGATGYNVYVKASGASGWTKLDAMLVREYPGYWRADALGLKAGTYQLKVVPVVNGSEADEAAETNSLTVKAHDRSGYGFVNGTSSGAYNEDGTLKSNAVVVYVTDTNKNSVTATIGGATYTGLSNILAASVIKKSSVPICIRLIGNITDLGSGDAFDKGDLLIDNGGNTVGLTIEGVGYDATCNGWGIRLKNSSNVEIRNLAVMNTDSSEGDNIGLQQANDHIWVHNCDLFYGHAGSDADQIKGDGALDTKKSHNVTHSYNHFWDTGKSNLQGGSTSDTSDNITYHHNWYDHSDSRHPRVRVATVHVYNNYYDGVSKYGIGAAYKSEIISEGNYFRNTKNPMLISTMGSDEGVETMSGETPGTLTSYKDYVTGVTSWIPNVDGIQGATAWNASSYDCVIVNTTYNAYSYNLQTAEEAMVDVQKYAGRVNGGDFIWNFDDATEDTNYDVITELKSALVAYKGSVISAGGEKITSGTGGDGSISGNGPACVHANTTTKTVNATCGTAGSTTVTCTDCGNVVSTTTIPATGKHTPGADATCVTAQTCTVCGAVITAATGEHKYVGGICSVCGKTDASTCQHTNKTAATVDATCTAAGSITETCDDCGTVVSTTTIPATSHTPGADATCTTAQTCTDCGTELTAALGHSYSNGTCTRCGAAASQTSNYSFDATRDVTVGADKDTIAANTTYADGYFTIVGTVTQRVSSGKVTSVEVAKNETGAIAFTVTGTAVVEVQFSSTGTSNTSTIGLYDASDNLIANNEGITTVTGASSGKTVVTYNLEAGTYRVLSPQSSTYNRGARVYYINVTETSSGESHVHSYTESVTTEATCTTEGLKTFTCACNHSYTETIPATNHANKHAGEAKEATCTTDGNTAGVYCPDCQTWLEEQVTIPAGHVIEQGAAQTKTCTQDGWDAYEYCTECDYTTQVVIPAGHTIAQGEAQEKTCTQDGWDAYEYCTECDYTTQVVIPAGHTIAQGEAQEKTCTQDGWAAYEYCTECDYTTKVVIPAGHTYVDGVCSGCGEADPTVCTCTIQCSDGSVNSECAVCTADLNGCTGSGDIGEPDWDDKTLVFDTQGISFQHYIGLQSSVKKNVVDQYDEVYAMVGSEKIEGYLYRGVYVFDVQVMAIEMTKEVTITLYGVKDGKTYTGEKRTSSVEALALEKLPAYEAVGYDKYCTALVDLLKYGAAAQVNFASTDPMPDANLGDYDKYATTEDPLIAYDNTTTGTGTVTAYTTSLSMQSILEINIGFKKDLTNYEAHVTVNGETETYELEAYSGIYVLKIPVGAMNARTEYTVTVHETATGAQVSPTYVVSAEGCVKAKLAATDTTADNATLCRAVMRYCDAVIAAFEDIQAERIL